MVRSRFLTPEHLIQAMKRGDFYASSGVSLRDVRFDEASRTLDVVVDAEPGVSYQTQFIATLKGGSTSKESIGVVVKENDGVSASYQMTGKELYVRAVVTSDQPHNDPSFKGQKTQAWTQPVGWDK